MDKTRCCSESAIEKLRSQLAQIQIDVNRGIDETLERSLRIESQLKEHISVAIKEQVALVSKEFEERMNRFEARFDQIFKQQMGKEQVQYTGIGIKVGVEGKESVASGDVSMVKGEPKGGHGDTSFGYSDILEYLPEPDFPKFDGTDPVDWVMKSESIFELYQVPEVDKTRWAMLSFVGDACVWYRCHHRVGDELPPWEVLVEEVMGRFGFDTPDPVEEFKEVHQVGKVEEYIVKFERAKARLIRANAKFRWFNANPDVMEPFFVASFISGLEEGIKLSLKIYEPRNLNDAYDYAYLFESGQECRLKRSKGRKNLDKGYKVEGVCPVCMDALSVGAVVQYLPCRHIFHKECIDIWLRRRNSCFICKIAIK